MTQKYMYRMAANIVAQIQAPHVTRKVKSPGFCATVDFEMAAQRWMLVTLPSLRFGDGGAAREGGSRATYLAVHEETYRMEIEAIYSRTQEPNNETYYNGMVKKEHKYKTWCNQCMCETSRKGDLKEMEGGNGTPTTRSWSWLGSSYGMENYEIKNLANGTYEAHTEYELKNVEGMEVEYDEGLEVKNDMISLAVLNELYKYINEGVYVVIFVYINVYKNLTAELYRMMMMMMMMGALWMWMRRSTRKRMRRTRKSHLSYYKYKLRGKVLRPEVPWSEYGAQGLTEPCDVECEEVVLHVPIARHEKRREVESGTVAGNDVQRTGYGRITCGWEPR